MSDTSITVIYHGMSRTVLYCLYYKYLYIRSFVMPFLNQNIKFTCLLTKHLTIAN